MTVASAGVLSQGVRGVPTTPKPIIIKGDLNNPLKKKEIERVQEQIHSRIQSMDASPSEIALMKNPALRDATIVGYGLAVKDGAPVEMLKTVSNPTPLSELSHASDQATKSNLEKSSIGGGADQQNTTKSVPKSLKSVRTDESLKVDVNLAHAQLDNFRQKHMEDR